MTSKSQNVHQEPGFHGGITLKQGYTTYMVYAQLWIILQTITHVHHTLSKDNGNQFLIALNWYQQWITMKRTENFFYWFLSIGKNQKQSGCLQEYRLLPIKKELTITTWIIHYTCTISKMSVRVSSGFQTCKNISTTRPQAKWFYWFRAFGNLMIPKTRVFEMTSLKKQYKIMQSCIFHIFL